MAVDLKVLVARLSSSTRSALEAAVGLAMTRAHYGVEIEHWLLKLVDAGDTDMVAILRHFEVDPGRIEADLTRVVDRFKTGNGRAAPLAPNLVRLLRESWLAASLEAGEPMVRSGHVLAALLGDDALGAVARDASGEFRRIDADRLRAALPGITSAGSEKPEGDGPQPGKAPSAALEQYTINLTARARNGGIDPVLGRDAETRQLVDILGRRRQNNPILTGEAGVGKTAVIEGLALKIASGDVPDDLKQVELLSLDLGLLQAGAGMKGEFESRLKGVIEGVKASPKPIIVFIDEAHTLIGAGGAAGQNDAANLLKPALARGEMRTIAATTWAEYKKYFERDPALTRRFQVVRIDEPDDEKAIAMMRGIVPALERHHGVRILSEAVEDAVRLSRRYIPSRQLPDKAVSLLDTAAGRVAVAGRSTPAAIEDARRLIEMQEAELAVLKRERRIGADHAARLAELTAQRAAAQEGLDALEARFEREEAIVKRVRALHEVLERESGSPAGENDAGNQRGELRALEKELGALQGEHPLMRASVDSQSVAEVIANWTGIPVGRMVSDEIRTVLDLKHRLEERVIGQPHALEAIAETIRTSRARLSDPRKPIGVFLLVGTSGVGKTETALAVAELLYGGEQNLTVINMSEFKEEHKVSMLVGSPPGYVGFGEGGVLTEAVRRRPYSVILLDEVEKAHPGVQDVFYQVFDKGMLRDGEGRDIDFRNTVVILTSNAGTDLIHRLCDDPASRPSPERLSEALRPELLKTFKPAFLGRCSIVPYFPLADDVLHRIVELQLDRIARRFRDTYKAALHWDADLVEAIAARCTEVESGARNVEYILSRSLLPELSAQVLGRLSGDRHVVDVQIELGADGSFCFNFLEAVSGGRNLPELEIAAQ